MLTKEDIKNILAIMNRVEYKGLNEAGVAHTIRVKLEFMFKQEEPNVDQDGAGSA